MKRVLSLGLAAVLSFSISACTPKTQTNPSGTPGKTSGITTKIYKDGTFTGSGNKTANGNEVAAVTIKGGRITNITLRRIDRNGKEIPITNMTGTTPGTTRTTTGTTPGTAGTTSGTTVSPTTTAGTVNYYDIRNTLMNSMMKAQSYNVNITVPSAAAPVIANWKLAARRALDKARV